MAAPETHALLSASSAERWLNCPGSVQLTKDMPDTVSTYAEEGRLAHAVAELKLRKKFIEKIGPKAFAVRMNKLKAAPLYQEEMQGYTDQYVEYITCLANSFPTRPWVAAEHRVDYSAFAPEGFGTADCILLCGAKLCVIDFKYGKGVEVRADHNPQMMLYALGAVLEYRAVYDIDTVHMAIVQPRAGGISEYEVSREELMDWAAFTLRPAAEKAFAGAGEYRAGDWCRFCRAKAVCRKHADSVVAVLEDFAGDLPALLSNEEVAEILKRVKPLQVYVDAVKEYAEHTLLSGGVIPGWKMVEGRAVRVFDDQAAAFADLVKGGVEDTLLWHREPYTLAQIEKQLGKKVFSEIVGAHVVRQPGKPTLAQESDPREPYSAGSVAADFGEG